MNRSTVTPGRPFRRSQALASGIRDGALNGPDFRRLFYDVYIASAVVVTSAVRAEAALLVNREGSHVSHHTAAELWGAYVPHDPDTHLTVPGSLTRRRGIRTHRRNGVATVTQRAGIPVSSPTQVFLELAAVLPLVELVAVGDSLVRARRVAPAALVAAAREWRGHGARLARRAAALVRDGVDSPMETRLRVLIVLAGLPEPTVNHTIRNDSGDVVMRFDLSYPAIRLAIEDDGRQHAESDQQWGSDIERREALDRGGWRLLVVRAKDIYVTPAQTLSRIVAVLHELGFPVRRELRPDWSRHFPGHPTSGRAA